MIVLEEKTYKVKKSYFIYLLFFELLLIFFWCFALNALLYPDKNYPEPEHVIVIYLIVSFFICIILTWLLLTRFHTVRIGAEYMLIGNYRCYYQDIAISKVKEQLIKYKIVHLVTVKQKYHYSFFIVLSRPQRRQKRYYFQSNCYTDFPELYEALCRKIRPIQE